MQDGQNKPGLVFEPGDSAPEQPGVPETSNTLPRPIEELTPQPSVPEDTTPEPTPVAPQETEPVYESNTYNDSSSVEWTASEFIANQKNSGWFGALIVGCLVLAAVVYVLTRDIVSTIVIVVLGIIVAIFANHKPRSLTYRLDSSGVHIGEKSYPYSSFRSFSIGHEHAMSYISLTPLKRFMPPISIHYAPEDEEAITETLADYLPFEEHKLDMVDRLSKKFRF